MFFVQIYVLYIRTFLSQSPHSLTHSLSCDRNPILSIESMKLEHGRMDYIHWMHMYAEAYMYAHILPTKDFFASMERDQVFTNDLALHQHTTSYNQNILKYLCYVNKHIPSSGWFGWI